MHPSRRDSKPSSGATSGPRRIGEIGAIRDLRSLYASRTARGRAALWVVALTLAAGALRPVAVSILRMASALRFESGATVEARSRIFGIPYTRAVDAIRKQIPGDAPFALVEAGDEGLGGTLWLRYDLAPRKAIDLGSLETLAAQPEEIRRLPAEVRWIVVSHGDRAAAELLDRRQMAALVERKRHGG